MNSRVLIAICIAIGAMSGPRAFAQDADALKKAQSQELAVLGRKMAETETKLTAAEERIEDLEAERDAQRATIEATQRELESVNAQLAAAKSEVEGLTAVREEQTARIAALETSEQDLRERLARAEGKIRGDEELLERARRAFAIGLSLLEDQKNGSADA